MDDTNSRKRNILWNASPASCPAQTFPSHILHFLLSKFQVATLNEIGKQLIVSMWPANWCEFLYGACLDTLLTFDCGATNVVLKKSLIKHLFVRLGIFDSWKFDRDVIVGFTMSVCFKPSAAFYEGYGGPFMFVAKDVLKKWTKRLLEGLMEHDDVEHGVWIILWMFCTMWFLNYALHLHVHGATESESVHGP